MVNIRVNDLSLWQFDSLSKVAGIRHFVSDRGDLQETGPFTVSFSSHPDRDVIVKNRQRLADAIGVSPKRLFFPSQVHGTRIVTVTADTSKDQLMGTDALITAEQGVCIAVMSADCVPILLYDPHHRVVAAIHSGWRGTVATILTRTLQAMKDQFNTDPRQLLAAIGPSICQESYEVGEEVLAEVEKTFGKHNRLVQPTTGGRGKLDLWKANKIQLLEGGVEESNIEVGGICTVLGNTSFFSARKGDKGRFAAGIMLV